MGYFRIYALGERGQAEEGIRRLESALYAVLGSDPLLDLYSHPPSISSLQNQKRADLYSKVRLTGWKACRIVNKTEEEDKKQDIYLGNENCDQYRATITARLQEGGILRLFRPDGVVLYLSHNSQFTPADKAVALFLLAERRAKPFATRWKAMNELEKLNPHLAEIFYQRTAQTAQDPEESFAMVVHSLVKLHPSNPREVRRQLLRLYPNSFDRTIKTLFDLYRGLTSDSLSRSVLAMLEIPTELLTVLPARTPREKTLRNVVKKFHDLTLRMTSENLGEIRPRYFPLLKPYLHPSMY